MTAFVAKMLTLFGVVLYAGGPIDAVTLIANGSDTPETRDMLVEEMTPALPAVQAAMVDGWLVVSSLMAGLWSFLVGAGYVAPRDAFFIAFAVLAIYTGNQLLARENQPLGQALASIFTKPASHGSSISYVSGLVVAGLSTLVVAQVLTFS
eukprot:s1_g2813.t1